MNPMNAYHNVRVSLEIIVKTDEDKQPTIAQVNKELKAQLKQWYYIDRLVVIHTVVE